MDRRTFVFSAAAMASGLAPVGRARAARVARIGLVLPLTGARAADGRIMRDAAMLAVGLVNRERRSGRPFIAAQILDGGSQASGFAAGLRRLVADENVISVFGLCPPGERAGMRDFLAAQSGLFWESGPAESGECHPNIIHGGPTPHHSLSTLLAFMIAEVGRRFLLVGDGHGGRRDLLAAATAVLGQSGATQVGEAALVHDGDFDLVLRRIRRERIDVVLSVLEGDRQVGLLRAYRQSRLDPLEIPIASPTLTEFDMVAAGPGVAAGHIAVQPYFSTWGSPENARFLGQLRGRHGPASLPTAMAEAAWWQIHLFARALDALGPGELHPVTIREAARDRWVTAPQGKVRLDGATLHAELWPKVAVVEQSGRAKVLARTMRAIAPLPTWGMGNRVCRETIEMVDEE
jgi:ABC-type branched-subunit amino acid transport system substrate-binding protein